MNGMSLCKNIFKFIFKNIWLSGKFIQNQQIGTRMTSFDAVLFPAGIYLFKVNNENGKMCEICSKLTIKTPEQRRLGFVN